MPYRHFFKSLCYEIVFSHEASLTECHRPRLYRIDGRRFVRTCVQDFGLAAPLPPGRACCLHAGWVLPDRCVAEKVETWGHAAQVIDGWYERVWQAWDAKTSRDFHPLWPTYFERVRLCAPAVWPEPVRQHEAYARAAELWEAAR